MLQTTKVNSTALTTNVSWIWGGDYTLEMVLLAVGSDLIIVVVENNGQIRMTYDLNELKSVYKVDSGDALALPVYTYAPTRWCLNFRQFGGMYPEGPAGVRIGLKTSSGSRTLDSAMVFWKQKTAL